MDSAKRDFIQLFNDSGWTQAEAARHLEMTRGGLNGIIKGETVPHPSTLKLFRYILDERKREGGEVLKVPHHGDANPIEIRDSPSRSELEIWRDRAKVAEADLEFIRNGMRILIEAKRLPASSSKSPIVLHHLFAALETLDPVQLAEAKELARKILENKT